MILRVAMNGREEVAIAHGEFLEVMIDFAIVAFTIFIVLKFVTRFKDKAEDPDNIEIKTPEQIELRSNLEKLMTKQNQILKKSKGA
ncbi:MscL family protein [Maribacter antarcticus]|uniref:MscL family protein n=1 Tax=Maribacter antarcticus TaxID=505250 RepID=UPI00293510A8|nr:MscL family protein [Maribacter antarcticus]